MQFIGHSKNWKLLLSEAKKEQLPHASLFYGTPGIGKKRVAYSLMQWHVCDKLKNTQRPSLFANNHVNFSDDRPCDTCVNCNRIITSHHPDFFYLSPNNSHSIKIDEVRSLQKALSRTSLEAPYKMILINEAHDMTAQAANSLLKTLEEPPKNTFFILITSSLFKILPTIRSRCRKVYFSPPPINESLSLLKQKLNWQDEKIRELLEIADESPGLALQLAEEGYSETLEELENLATNKNPLFSKIGNLASTWSQKNIDLALFLQLVKKKHFKKMVHDSHWDSVHKLDLLNDAGHNIDRNVNKNLVLENLLMDLFSYAQ